MDLSSISPQRTPAHHPPVLDLHICPPDVQCPSTISPSQARPSSPLLPSPLLMHIWHTRSSLVLSTCTVYFIWLFTNLPIRMCVWSAPPSNHTSSSGQPEHFHGASVVSWDTRRGSKLSAVIARAIWGLDEVVDKNWPVRQVNPSSSLAWACLTRLSGLN